MDLLWLQKSQKKPQVGLSGHLQALISSSFTDVIECSFFFTVACQTTLSLPLTFDLEKVLGKILTFVLELKPYYLLALTPPQLSCRGLLPPCRWSMWRGAGKSQFLLFKEKALPWWSGQLQWLWLFWSSNSREKLYQAGESSSKTSPWSCRGGSCIFCYWLPSGLWKVGSDSLYGEAMLHIYPWTICMGWKVYK